MPGNAVAMRSMATATYAGLISMALQRRARFWQATIAVPLPQSVRHLRVKLGDLDWQLDHRTSFVARNGAAEQFSEFGFVISLTGQLHEEQTQDAV